MICNYSFAATTIAHFIYDTETKSAMSGPVHFGLDVEGQIKKDLFFSEPHVFNDQGSIAFTEATIQGIVSNIHVAHQKGWRDSAEHLRYVIDKITEGFTAVHGDIRTEVAHKKMTISTQQNEEKQTGL